MFAINPNYNFNGGGLMPIDFSHLPSQVSNANLTIPSLNYPNIFGQITAPLTPNINPNIVLANNQSGAAQNASGDILGYPPECLLLGQNCPDSIIGNSLNYGYDIFKKIGLLLLALVLLGFGLFLLAESSKAGQAALNVATKL